MSHQKTYPPKLCNKRGGYWAQITSSGKSTMPGEEFVETVWNQLKQSGVSILSEY